MQDYEKLGVFYLGKEYDLSAQQLRDDLILYDSKDLVTHAVCVGMTGSGKTGLCVALIEEAAIDGVPAILIDPKGDLANLLLTFPNLRGDDFLPWINEEDAAKKGMSSQDYANKQAATWLGGLADWGQNPDRIKLLRDKVDMTIYTPGSSAGLSMSILKSFAAPGQAVMDDGELLRERISTTVTSLLGLLGIDADPLQSREHILISNLLDNAWKQGKDLDLAALIGLIQTPPMTKIGVLDLDAFYPAKDRFGLVMALNNLLASPGFNAWLEGEPLDVGRMLYSPGGKPKLSIVSIAHLSDAERMFFVSLLLNQTLGWMRQQSGTTSLRAILYMDEIFGYFPPTANPPSKQPLLTLLKQARAFGLGIVLATQNPVDLDYKGLSNAGTWFIGRLQTDRDKQRVLDGLEGAAVSASGGYDRSKMEQTLAGLGNRVFLMNNTHEDAPVVFQTRWVMSYLRGPLTRNQIKTLMDPIKAASPITPTAAPVTPIAPAAPAAAGVQSVAPTPMASSAPIGQRPALPAEIQQFFIPARGRGGSVFYRPVIFGAAKVNFVDTKTRLDFAQDATFATAITDNAIPVNWEDAQPLAVPAGDLERTSSDGAQFAELPPAASKARSYAAWQKDLVTWLYGTQQIELFFSPSTKTVSQPGEDERDFRIRLSQSTREKRDKLVDQMRKKYAPKVAALQERIRKAQEAVDREKSQADQQKMQTAISFGATLLGALGGRKINSSGNIGKATMAIRGAGRTMKEGQDIARAEENVKVYQQQLAELNAEVEAQATELSSAVDPQSEVFETLTIKPKKTNINVQLCTLVWAPYWKDEQGTLTPAWE
ncbi:MAG: ATP-binding protein [Chloroflexi bacterium]|nr:ATP-binding protein [Chloroflexota bacterium]